MPASEPLGGKTQVRPRLAPFRTSLIPPGRKGDPMNALELSNSRFSMLATLAIVGSVLASFGLLLVG